MFVQLLSDRCKTISEMCEKSLYFYQDIDRYDENIFNKFVNSTIEPALNALYKLFEQTERWDKEIVQNCISEIVVSFDLNMGKIAQPLRVIVTEVIILLQLMRPWPSLAKKRF